MTGGFSASEERKDYLEMSSWVCWVWRGGVMTGGVTGLFFLPQFEMRIFLDMMV